MVSNCACIKKTFDLYIGSQDCKTMVIEDQSVWMASSGFSDPVPFEVEIKSLTNNTSNKITVDPNNRNLFTSVNLFGTNESQCISDGFYCFTTVSCGVSYTINRVYLCNVRCQLDTVISNSNRSNIRDIEEAEFLIKAVELNTKLGKLNVAAELFKMLQLQLQKLGCDSKSCCG